MSLEKFRSGGLDPRKWQKFNMFVLRLLLVVGSIYVGSWLLSWHFVRALGLFFIMLAALLTMAES